MKKGKLYQQEMQHLVSKWQQSGMSQRAFSASENISYEKLRYWNKKLNNLKPNSTDISPSSPIPDFIPIDVTQEVNNFSGLQLTYPNQVTITCPTGIGLKTLKSLIKLF